LIYALKQTFELKIEQNTRNCFHLATILHKIENTNEEYLQKIVQKLEPIEDEIVKRIDRKREIALIRTDYEAYSMKIIRLIKKHYKPNHIHN